MLYHHSLSNNSVYYKYNINLFTAVVCNTHKCKLNFFLAWKYSIQNKEKLIDSYNNKNKHLRKVLKWKCLSVWPQHTTAGDGGDFVIVCAVRTECAVDAFMLCEIQFETPGLRVSTTRVASMCSACVWVFEMRTCACVCVALAWVRVPAMCGVWTLQIITTKI